MGTRHLQMVINKVGETKLRQYGQWDGYPSGQGVNILNYFLRADLEKYQAELDKIPKITQEQVDMVNATENWHHVYPYLSRDCGSDIHQMIEDGEVQFVMHLAEGEEYWIEGYYTIDFQKNLFTAKFHGKESKWELDSLPSVEEFLSVMEPDDEEE